MKMTQKGNPNVQITRTVNPNESSRNVGKARWQGKVIRIKVLHMNVTYHLIFETLQNAQTLKLVITHHSYSNIQTPVTKGGSLKLLNSIGQRNQFNNCDGKANVKTLKIIKNYTGNPSWEVHNLEEDKHRFLPTEI